MSLSPKEWIDTIKNTADYLYHQYIDSTEQSYDNPESDITYIFPRCLYYDSFCSLQLDQFASHNYSLSYPCSVSLDASSQLVVTITGDYIDSDFNSSYALDLIDSYGEPTIIGSPVMQLNSFLGCPLRFNADGYFLKRYYDNSSDTPSFTKCSYVVRFPTGRTITYFDNIINNKLHYPSVSSYTVIDDTYDFGMLSSYPSTNDCWLPYIYTNSGGIINVNTFMGDSINNYYENTLNYTKNTYNYITNEGDNVSINFYPEGGFIDLSPLNGLSLNFDDIIGIFNGIVPVVNLDNDFDPSIHFPSWTDLVPSTNTDIQVNIDLPDVTGEYPAETITPIESDVYNIMSIDSMPQLPSLTGIDNGESAAALGSSFTFLDGCGLLMPFVTIAIIRLLISKFRGDS